MHGHRCDSDVELGDNAHTLTVTLLRNRGIPLSDSGHPVFPAHSGCPPHYVRFHLHNATTIVHLGQTISGYLGKCISGH